MKSTADAYGRHLREHLVPMLREPERVKGLFEKATAVLSLLMLDLEPAREIVLACYARTGQGRPPREPVGMLRAFVLMALWGCTAINEWVTKLKARPELVVLRGFTPDDGAPGVATFYDFGRRLLDGPPPKGCRCDWRERRPSRPLTARRFRRHLNREKQVRKAGRTPPPEGRVRQEVEDALARLELPVLAGLSERLGRILLRCAVVPSARMGLLGDTKRLEVVMDGSALPTQAASKGIRGSTGPDGARDYSDPQATWGWDSYRKCFYFGHKLHGHGVPYEGKVLPIYQRVEAAHEHDGVLAARDIVELQKLLREELPEAGFGPMIGDLGYDATALYDCIVRLGGIPIIALSPNSVPVTDEEERLRDPNGVPLCPAGLPMRRATYDRPKMAVIYNCPVKRPGRHQGRQVMRHRVEECPQGVLCEPHTKMGPLVRVRVRDNPRLNLPIPRGTRKFDALMKKRSCIERYYSWVKTAGGLGERPYRRRHLFALVTTCKALCAHARVWVQRRFGKTLDTTDDFRAAVLALLGEPAAA